MAVALALLWRFVACERAIARGEDDEWARPTLLGAAFRSGDIEKAEEFAERIQLEGAASWQLKTTLEDLKEAVRQTEDAEVRGSLEDVVEELKELV